MDIIIDTIIADGDWLKHLKILAHVPFNVFMRSSFNIRCSLIFQTLINPEDFDNVVLLPRLVPASASSVGIQTEADPVYIYSAYLWSSLWRNVFFDDGEDWGEDPEAQKLVELGDTGLAALEAHLKPRYEAIYKDHASANAKNWELLQAWQKLASVLGDTFQSGSRFCRFIVSLSFPAPPAGFEVAANIKIERQVFAKKLALALKTIQMPDPIAFSIIKQLFSDSPEIVSYIDKRLAMQESIQMSNFNFSIELEGLEKMCSDFNSKMRTSFFKLSPEIMFAS